MKKPAELSPLFHDTHFRTYPLIEIPQSFQDARGLIANIADGSLGDVAVITSHAHSIRANHYHEKDWHLSYLITGSIIYTWKAMNESDRGEIVIKAGELFYTPPMTAHRMSFTEDTVFVAVSKLNRNQEDYESDTRRLHSGFFA